MAWKISNQKSKQKLIGLLEKDLCFRVFVKNKGMICPYCMILIPIQSDDPEFIDKAIFHFTDECSKFEGVETEPADYQALLKKRKALAQDDEIRKKVTEDPAWRVIDKAGTWVCPFCGKASGIKVEKKPKSTDAFVRKVTKHLKACFDYTQHPDKFKTADELKNVAVIHQKEKFLKEELKKKIQEQDEHYIQKNPVGHWICPYCLDSVSTIPIQTELLLKENAPPLMAHHFIYECPVDVAGSKMKSLQEIKDAAQKTAAQGKETSSSGQGSAYFSSLKNEIDKLKEEIAGNDELKQSLKKAHEFVAAMLPEENPQPEGYEIATVFQPSSEIGGDFYDFLELDNGSFSTVIGDISGHGLDTALIMGMMRKAVSMRQKESDDPVQVLIQANADIYPDIEEKAFVTCFYGVLNPAENKMDFIRAGHNFAIIFKSETSDVKIIESQGMPLGVVLGTPFESSLEVSSVFFEPGDLFIQYTDGLTEALDETEEEFGLSRFMDAIKRYSDHNAEYAANKIINAVNDFIVDSTQKDDISLLVIRRKKEGEE